MESPSTIGLSENTNRDETISPGNQPALDIAGKKRSLVEKNGIS